MFYEILDLQGNVENKIEADQSFVESVYPGRWRLAGDQLSDPESASPEWYWYIDQGPFTDRMGAETAFVIDTSSNPDMVAIRSDFARRKWIDLKDPRVTSAVHYLAGQTHPLLGTISQPLLTTVKADEILNTIVSPSENRALRALYFKDFT